MFRMRRCVWGLVILAGTPAIAQAGMPRPTVVMNELVRLRLENISFFLAGFLLSALCIQLLWNYLRRDWTALPRLSYLKAVGLLTLWGLFFVLVLTMISGARELMTPGAWEPDGATYRLANKGQTEAAKDDERRHQIEKLRDALWDFAKKNSDRFPAARSDSAIPAERWTVPDPSGMQYLYQGGAISLTPTPLAYEPGLFGPSRYVLFTNGDIRRLTHEQILEALPPEKR